MLLLQGGRQNGSQNSRRSGQQGAPRRRGKKPCRRRPDDFPMLDVPAASLSMRERAALCKERLLAESEDEVLAAQERVDSMTYVE